MGYRMCMRVFVGMLTHVYTQRSQRSTQVSSPIALHLFFKTEPPSEPGVHQFLSWLATELHIASCFHHVSTEISEACRYTQLSYVSAGVHTTGGWVPHSPASEHAQTGLKWLPSFTFLLSKWMCDFREANWMSSCLNTSQIYPPRLL